MMILTRLDEGAFHASPEAPLGVAIVAGAHPALLPCTGSPVALSMGLYRAVP